MYVAKSLAGDAVTDMFLNGLDALAQAGIICFLGIAIIVSNILIIATLLNYKGKYQHGNSSHGLCVCVVIKLWYMQI